jgi:hypothetical protein
VRRAEQDLQQVAHVTALDEGVAQREVRHHLVVVPPSLSLPQDIVKKSQPDASDANWLCISRTGIHESNGKLDFHPFKEASHGRNPALYTDADTSRPLDHAPALTHAPAVGHATAIAGPRPIPEAGAIHRRGVIGRANTGAPGRPSAFSELKPNPKGTAMPKTITPDQVVEAAEGLEKDEFTREDLAKKLGTKKPDLMKGFRQARKAGRLEKVRDDEEGTGHFRVKAPATAPAAV